MLIGAFVAGPVVARELESGTYKVAWTQSVSPRRWFAAKIAVPAAAVLGGMSLLAAAYTWAWQSLPLKLLPGEWWWRSIDMLGPVPVGRALLGLAVGALAGLLLRRTVPALGATIFAHVLLAWPLESLRRFLVRPATDLTADMPGLVRGSDDWIVERGMIGPGGDRIPEPECGMGISPSTCLEQHHATGWYLDYYPRSSMWPMLWAEAGLAVVLAVAVTGVAAWVVRRTYP